MRGYLGNRILRPLSIQAYKIVLALLASVPSLEGT